MMSIRSWLQEFRQGFTLERAPSAVKKSWVFFSTLMEDIKQTNLMLHASSMAYMSLGSIVPLLALTFAILSAFQPIAAPDANWFTSFKLFILKNLAPQSGQDMVAFIETYLANLDVAKIGLTGLLILIVLIIILLRDIEMALNSIWQVPQTRSLLKRFMFFWITTTLGALCLSIVVAAFSHFNSLGGWSSTDFTEQTRSGRPISDGINLLVTFIFFSVLQKFGPNCYVSTKAAMVGGLAATIMIRLASAGFGLYSANSRWNQDIYEALAVVPLFLLWLYLAWFVILLSAVIAWRTHHGFKVQRAHEAGGAGRPDDDAMTLRDLQIRSLLPFVCVMMAGMRFLEAKGQGSEGRQIAADLDIPPYWVREGLLIAEKLGLLVIKRPADRDAKENDILELMAYPSFPLHQMTLQDLMHKLSEDTSLWLNSRPTDLPINLQNLLEKAYSSLREHQGQISLAALLEGPTEYRPT